MVLSFVLRSLLIFLAALNLTISGYDYRLYNYGNDGSDNYMCVAFVSGDLNGDGKKDIVVVNPVEVVSGVNCGAVYVYYGKTSQDFSSYDVKIWGVAANDDFGSYAQLTDINNDGFDDLIIGAPNAKTEGGITTGAVYLIAGRSSFAKDNSITSLYNNRVFGPENNAKFGNGGSFTQGDVNQDGYKDFMIGAPGTNLNTVYLFLGNNQLNATSPQTTVSLGTNKTYAVEFYPNPRSTRTVGRAGMDFCDLDNNGYDDIVIGDYLFDYNASLTNAGAVRIKYCNVSFPGSVLAQSVVLESGMSASWIGETAEDRVGTFDHSADIDGDGRRDLILSAPTQTSNGKVYIIRNTGGSTQLSGNLSLGSDSNYDVKYIGKDADEKLGTVTSGFDVNSDGKADLFMGTSRVKPTTGQILGRIYLVNGAGVFAGDKTKLMSNASNYLMYFDETCPEETTTIPAINYKLMFGMATDINNDGLNDMFLSDNSSYGGHCFVIMGRTPAVTVTAPNGGENYTAGETKNLTWSMTTSSTLPADANPITLEYSTNGGTTYTTIATGQPNTGTYAWSVPAVNSTTARVRVTGANVLKTTGSDASDANFTIVSTAPQVSLQAPDGGEAWPSGSLQQIKWTASGGAAGLTATPISIYLSLDSGATFATRIVENLANTGTYDWTVPAGLDIGSARIKINALNTLGETGVGISVRDFAITTATGGGDVRVLEIKSGPSPFSPGGSSGLGAKAVSSAQIDYKLSSTASASVYIFDSTGGLKWKKDFTAGTDGAHVGMNSVPWDGADSGGNLLPNGVYIIKIVAGGKVIGTDKIMIIK